MNKLLLISFCGVCILFSCKKDCPDKQYYMNIAFANNTGQEIEVELFPKTEYLHGEVFYRGSDFGGGYSYKAFSIAKDFTPNYSFEYVLYRTKDTVLNPNYLLAQVFDSIQITLVNYPDIKIVLHPVTAIGLGVNPFTDLSVWSCKWIDTSTPDNDCENKSETKMCKFYFEGQYFETEAPLPHDCIVW